jgi:hypothetical protein
MWYFCKSAKSHPRLLFGQFEQDVKGLKAVQWTSSSPLAILLRHGLQINLGSLTYSITPEPFFDSLVASF